MRRINNRSLTRAVIATFVVIGIHNMSLAQVNEHDLEERDGLLYHGDDAEPYTGPVVGDDRLTGQVKAGKREGEWIWRYDSGANQYMMTYADGERDGPRREWAKSGRLIHETWFANGKEDGKETLRTQDGDLLYTANHTSGELDGEVTWWYSEDRKRWETNYDKGKRTGTWSQYDPDGNLLMESIWMDGELVSRYNPHGEH